jgi:CubicO group peptidase (beta-lactamase class C family)
LQFEPGAKYEYSNTGYLLLGVIIHKVSGQFYGDLLAERVFRPLGMSTARVISEADIVPHRAAGYQLVDGQVKNQDWVAPSLNTTADGALYLSALDMVAWDKGLRAGAILKPDSWKQVYTPVRLNSGEDYPYGFGWRVSTRGGAPLYSHGGSWQGFKAYIARYLGADLTIILFANLADTETAKVVAGWRQSSTRRLHHPRRRRRARNSLSDGGSKPGPGSQRINELGAFRRSATGAGMRALGE